MVVKVSDPNPQLYPSREEAGKFMKQFQGLRSQPRKTHPTVSSHGGLLRLAYVQCITCICFSYLTHLILSSTLGLSVRVIGLQLVGNLDVQVALVLVVGLVLQETLDLFALLDGKNFAEVEDSLFPVSVLCMRASGESDGLVAGGKVDIEPCNQSMDEVITTYVEGKLGAESKVGHGAGVEIERQDGCGISDNSLDLDGVDERLGEGGVLER